MHYLQEAIHSVPPIVWSGVVGAMIALFGTWLQNRASYRRQQEQLRHDSEQRLLERERNIKREVCLAAIESLSTFKEYIAHFGDLTLTDEQLREFMIGTEKHI